MKVYRKQHPDSTKRRLGVIGRLEAQLQAGTKTAKNMELVTMEGKPSNIVATLPLTEADKVRINKELVTLKLRV
jgi:hypothetical protein